MMCWHNSRRILLGRHQINMCNMFSACSEFQFRSQHVRVTYVSNIVLPLLQLSKRSCKNNGVYFCGVESCPQLNRQKTIWTFSRRQRRPDGNMGDIPSIVCQHIRNTWNKLSPTQMSKTILATFLLGQPKINSFLIISKKFKD